MKLFCTLLVGFLGASLVSSRFIQNEGRRLIKTEREKPGEWMTQEQIADLIVNQRTFIDITDRKYPAADPNTIKATSIPKQLRFQELVKSLNEKLDSTKITKFVTEFSSFRNRYYASATGRQSQLWLLKQVQDAANNRASVREIDHGYLQRSIVARIEGSDPTLKHEVVIFGAHLDSVNKFGASLQSPGSDDNGSGSSVVLECLRVIAEENINFNRTVEFHWYAAEEIGLRGSEFIAEEYKAANVNVAAMLNMDVIGYHTVGRDSVGVYNDYGTSELVQFIHLLTKEFLEYKSEDLICGYGCSDHATWYDAGFPALMVGEIVDHPQMHTMYDNLENLDINQVHQFSKLAMGFLIEMGEPKNQTNF